MYDLDIIEKLLPSPKEKVFRSLIQNEANGTTSNSTIIPNNTNPSIPVIKQSNDSTVEIHINGNGVAGISVGVLFLIPVLIGSFALMSTFVNTKFLDQPIRIKVMD